HSFVFEYDDRFRNSRRHHLVGACTRILLPGQCSYSRRLTPNGFEMIAFAIQKGIVGAKNPIGLPIVELAAFRLVASSDHGQPYNNVAQIPSHRRSQSSGDAGRDHRAPSSTDRAAANSKDKPARPPSS